MNNTPQMEEGEGFEDTKLVFHLIFLLMVFTHEVRVSIALIDSLLAHSSATLFRTTQILKFQLSLVPILHRKLHEGSSSLPRGEFVPCFRAAS